ncbi:unnamed protein product [Mytilus coruscus]|uniref:Reverse transcriptase domain-containing protein n=1 Tax=Mytilus coruscus TaxID=42192 RepID=A0A6J8C421_MYTCO|nr:unnamed protein product [Mytilus coruscus]
MEFCGNNVVIFLSRYDRQQLWSLKKARKQLWYIHQLAKLLSKCIDGIFKKAKEDYFSANDFGKGLKFMVQEYKNALQDGKCSYDSSDWMVWALPKIECVKEQDGVGRSSYFLEYGLPLSCEGFCSGLFVEKNHAGARSHPDDMRKYLKKECTYGSIIGPFFSNPLETDMVISPLNSVPKKDTLDRRVILDLSFGVDGEDSVNSHICKDLYLGNPIKVSYPSVDSLVELIRKIGSGSLCFKRDLKRAYRQIPICPRAYICQRVTNAVSFILDAHYDLQIVNYLDDLAGCDVQEKAFDAYAILGEVLDNCGLEESVEMATPPSTSMVFLGILFDTDNSSSVTELNSGACRNAFMQSCLREICFLTASHEFQVKGRYLSGEANRVADMRSRWDMDPDNVSKNMVLLLSDSTCKYVNNINWLECNAKSGANIYTLHQFVKDNKALLRRYTHLLLHVEDDDGLESWARPLLQHLVTCEPLLVCRIPVFVVCIISSTMLNSDDEVQHDSPASHQSGDHFTARPKEPTVTDSEFSPADALSLFSQK